MKEERFIDGRRCRLYSSELYYMGDYYSDKKFWVADTVDFVVCEGDNEDELIPCDIGCSRSGPFIEEMSYEGYLDSIVMALFGPPQPDWDIHSRYLPRINHKDGNWMNCNINNLEWAPYHYRHSTAAREFVNHRGDIFEVHSTGNVIKDGEELPVGSQVIPAFLGAYYYLAQCIDNEYGQDIEIEELMAEAGYVQGDDANLVHPVILHIDGDYKNNDSNNLEWAEEYDPRYIDYLHKRNQALLAEKMMEFKRNNPGQEEWDIDERSIIEKLPAPYTRPLLFGFGKASDDSE